MGRSDRYVRGVVLRRMERTILERHVVGRTILVELDVHRPILERRGLELIVEL